MFEIDPVSDRVKEYLVRRGIDVGTLEIAAFSDRDRLQKPTEAWLFADAENLYVADPARDLLETHPLLLCGILR